VRNIRRDLNDDLKKMEKDGDISEDTLHRVLEKVQELTNDFIKQIDELLEAKEKEIMEI
jgi:ribosome recycling factor